MNRILIWLLLASAAMPARAQELTLHQRLIISCFNVQVDEVVKCLREGADVNARLGQCTTKPFYDRWTGGTPLGTQCWTPLIALASAHDYPAPPTELGQIWKERARARALLNGIPQDQIDKRRSDTMTILLLLLGHACKLDWDDGYGATALYKAVDNGKVAMARKLLEFGANPNTKTQVYIDGAGDTTPLHVAFQSKELVQLLLDHGADAAAKDSEGRTPADWIALDDSRDFDLVSTPDGPRVRPRDKTSTKAQ
ncbi:MAG: hypothetical protein WD063_18735 [Pirellulales bacterium]